MDRSGSARRLRPDARPFGLAQINASQSAVDLAITLICPLRLGFAWMRYDEPLGSQDVFITGSLN